MRVLSAGARPWKARDWQNVAEKKMKVLIAGSSGQLGQELRRALVVGGYKVAALGHGELDVTDPEAVRQAVERMQPEVILNAAAMTDVDACENDPEAAFRVNALGPRNLAQAAREVGALLVHVGTDHVFDGEKGGPYAVGDPVNPVNVYGRSKLAGEEAVRETAPDFLVVRTAWLYSGRGQKDFVRTVLTLLDAGEEIRMVEDQVGSPTFVPDLARAIRSLVEEGARGTWHVAGGGECSRFALARAVAEFSGRDPERIRPAVTADLPPRPARRPRRTSLVGRAPLRDWREALRECLEGVRAGAKY